MAIRPLTTRQIEVYIVQTYFKMYMKNRQTANVKVQYVFEIIPTTNF